MSEEQNKTATVVFGASPNPARYSHRAVEMLVEYGYDVLPLGFRKGSIEGKDIILDHENFENVDTVTMYMNAHRQEQFLDYILSLHPRRIIFNPGAENPKLETLAHEQGIETLNACTLVLLRIGSY